MRFLPEDYQAPKSSNNYMKMQDGENRIRILSAAVMGWEDWVDNKPIRYRLDEKPAKSHDPKKPIRHFWAFVVWNYQEERIQILHLVQATIRSNIETLCKDKDWGDPYFYDIKIIRKGEGTDTEYMVNPLPHKPASAKMVEEFNSLPCNLEALFDNSDPFSKEWAHFTKGVFERPPQEEPVSDLISADQVKELSDIFQACDPAYSKQVMSHLKKSTGTVDSVQSIPMGLYERIKAAAVKKRDEHMAKFAQVNHATA